MDGTGDHYIKKVSQVQKDIMIYTSSRHRESPLHVKRRNQESPGPPVTGAQRAWEDVDQVSFAVGSTPTDKPGPEQHSPLDRLTSTQGNKEKLSNKQ
jgi:hypothetical protein